MSMHNQPTKQIQRLNSIQQEVQNWHQADMKKIVENYEFMLGNVIIKNQYSQIYEGVQSQAQKLVAIKVIPIQKSLSPKQRNQMQNETRLCRILSKHKNIIIVYDTFTTTNNNYIMMEKASVDLKTLLMRKKVLSQEQVVPIMLDVLDGLRFLSSNGFIHCNIKPSNILIAQDGCVKITDFALMRKTSHFQKCPAFQQNQWTPYMHHLTLLTKTYNQNNDLWSLAVTIYQLMHGYHNFPWRFQNSADLLQKIYQNKIQFSRKVSKEMAQFLGKLLNPKNIITIEEIYNDPFIKLHLSQRQTQKPMILDDFEGFQRQKIFKNYSMQENIKKPSPPGQLERDPFLKISPEIPFQNNGFIPRNNQPKNEIKRHVSNYQTSSSPQRLKLHNQISEVQNNQRKISVKEIIDCQIFFMRFLTIVLKQDQQGYVPEIRDPKADPKVRQVQDKKEIDHMLFRFVLIKQMLGQKDCLKKTLDIYHPQNPFNIDGIDEFLLAVQNRETLKYYRKVMEQYDRKYIEFELEMKKLITDIDLRLSRIRSQWRPHDILTPNLHRKQIIPILGVRLSRQLCKHTWYEIGNFYSLLSTINPKNQKQINQKNQIISQMQERVRRVDFMITYYILNCLLIDNFSSPEYFVRNSALGVIMNHKPVKLEMQDFGIVEDKLRLLQII